MHRRRHLQDLSVRARRGGAALVVAGAALAAAAAAPNAEALPPTCASPAPQVRTLSNGPLTADGAVGVTVDGVGAFGHSVGGGQPALYNPPGPTGAAGTVYSSHVYLGPPFDNLLAGADVCVVEDTSTRFHTETSLSGFDLAVVQELGAAGGGSTTLTQTYTIRNTGTGSLSLPVVRHLDGDLAYDGTFIDGGGASFGGTQLFEFEDSSVPSAPSIFVGASGALGSDASPDRWTMQPFDYKDDLIASDGIAPAHDGVVANDANGDRIVDTPYDATQSQQWNATIAPGAEVTFTTVTTWGERPPNVSPQVAGEAVSTAFQTATTVSVLTNDADADGDPLSVSGFTAGANGGVTQSGGNLTYTPNAGFSGSDSFAYTVSDGRGGTGTGTVTVTVGAAPVQQPPPPPTPGQNVNVTPVAGTLTVKLPGTDRFVPLSSATQLPVGTQVDATQGTVELTAARSGGVTDTSRFREGAFEIAQQAPNTVTELKLILGDFAVCALPSFSAVDKNKRPVRRLWGSGKGRFRTRGRYSSATVRGTEWMTQDRCDGTLTRVTEGSVTVRDFGKRKDVVLNVGQSYLAVPIPRDASRAGCTIFGTDGRDVLRGTNRRDVICGLGGNDVIRGLGGNDKLLGGDGNDRLYGGAGNDVLDGGRGNDWLDGQAGADSVRGGAGKDFMVSRDGDRGNDRVNGGPGADRCRTDAVKVCP